MIAHPSAPAPSPARLAVLLAAGAIVGTLLAHPLMGDATPEAAPEVPSCVGCHTGGAPEGDPTSFSRFTP